MAASRASTTIPPLISFLAGLALVAYVVESHIRPTFSTVPVRQALPAPPATSGRRQPSAEEIERLRSGRDLLRTLDSLRVADVTPEFAAALDALDASGPASDVGVRRLIACHQARRPTTPLAVAIDALPADGPWLYAFGEVPCLIAVIAERATSDPERALPVLVRAAREFPNPDVLAALGKLDVTDLPEPVREDLRLPGKRSRGMTVAIALGAAAKWPDEVRAALADRDPNVKAAAVRALASRDDRASHAILARYVARHPKDRELAMLARVAMAKRQPMAEGLVDVAGDAAEAVDVRAHAAWLVSVEAEQPQAIRLAAIEAADPWLRARLAEAVATVERRFAIDLSRDVSDDVARRRRRARG